MPGALSAGAEHFAAEEKTMDTQETLRAISDPQFRQLCEETVAAMERLQVPGVALGVLYEGQEYAAGFGVTSLENPLPVTPETLFQIGSITKTFVATIAMRLVEMGKLNLDEPLRTYLPDLRLADEDTAARVTMRHLLTHTGGWSGDYFNDFGDGDDALARMVAKMADLPQLTPLGEVWSYNNSGFYLAGRVLEVIIGKPFEAVAKGLLLDPIGMSKSFFFAKDVITYRFVVGHELADGGAKVARPWPIGRAAHPAGGLISNVPDLFRYARFQMGDGTALDGTRLLSSGSLAQMQAPVLAAGGLAMMGLSWFCLTVDGAKILQHGGGTNGQVTLLHLVPARKCAIVVLTNHNRGGELTEEVTKSALKGYLGIALPEAVPLDLPVERLSEYVGRYDSALSLVELSLHGGGLVCQVHPKGGFPTPESPAPASPPAMRVALYAEDRIVVLDPPWKDGRGEFLRHSDGRIAWFRSGGRIHKRLD
jgi:CubicO group peptidase (beta-lactamase class C family)